MLMLTVETNNVIQTILQHLNSTELNFANIIYIAGLKKKKNHWTDQPNLQVKKERLNAI